MSEFACVMQANIIKVIIDQAWIWGLFKVKLKAITIRNFKYISYFSLVILGSSKSDLTSVESSCEGSEKLILD